MTRYAPGDTIGDTWVVVRALGAGSMGSVYRCRNALLQGVSAAVKVLPVDRDDAHALARVEREVQALGRLRHPNIVGLRGFGADGADGPCWIAMDLVEGNDLSTQLGRGAPPTPLALTWIEALCGALLHAHQHRVYHRDIKPSNIVITPTGPVLVDWGVVLHEDRERLTRAGAVPGTVPYFPPEVFQSGQVVKPVLCDLYAMGVVCFEILTGFRAFPMDPDLTTDQNNGRIIQKKLTGEALDPTDAPPALRRLVRALTAPDPAQRLADPDQIRALLQDARRATPKAATPAPTMPPTPPPTPPDQMPPPTRSTTGGRRQRPPGRQVDVGEPPSGVEWMIALLGAAAILAASAWVYLVYTGQAPDLDWLLAWFDFVPEGR